jgi:general secretion pathway protein C
MLTTPPSRWAVQGGTFALWALAAASAVAWGLKLSAPASSGRLAPVPGRAAATPDPAAVTRLLGASPAAAAAPLPSAASRFQLVGLADQRAGADIALIAVDGKPARPYRVGSQVDEGLVLQAVQGRRALLGPVAQGPATLTLELPPPKR